MTLYARQQNRHRCKEQTFGLCGRGRGWDDLGDDIETCIISSVKWIASPGSMQNMVCSGLVHWDDPERWDGEGGGWGVGIGNMSTPVVDSCSVQFSDLVVSDSLRPHESQHARTPCPSPTPRVHPDSRPSSWWCHPAISSSVVPFSSCPQYLPGSESFPMSQLFTCGGQSTGVSALASFLPKKSQGLSPLEWTGWCMAKPIQYCKVISLQLNK